MIGEDRKFYYCSFCGKSQDEVGQLIAGPGNLCMLIVLQHRREHERQTGWAAEAEKKS